MYFVETAHTARLFNRGLRKAAEIPSLRMSGAVGRDHCGGSPVRSMSFMYFLGETPVSFLKNVLK